MPDLSANRLMPGILWLSYDAYCGLGGMFSCQQILSNLTTHLGDDVVVERVEGCASVVGFKQL